MTAMQELARRAGLLDHYHTIDGTLHICSDATRAALLGAMGLAAETEDQAAATLARLDREAALPEHPDEMVVPVGIAVETGFREFRIVLEDGSERAGDAAHPGRLPPLPSGVHRLLADGRETLVIAAPDAAPLVAERGGDGLVWGVTAALYGLRSARNQGLGDFGDLAAAGAALGKAGAAFLGINPVHARGIADQGTSPYSPSSRTGFDTGHIAIDLIPEFAGCAEARELLGQAVPEPSDGLIDYAAIRARTRPALRAVHASFAAGSGARQAAFAKWREARDPALLLQSIYEALSEHHGPDWRAWPQALRVPESPEVRRFAADNAAAIDFHEWCQWIAEQQLAAAQQAAKAGGMSLGLYLDIAVGVRPGGAETWANRTAFAVGASLGAPPDLLNGNGQSWDLAPFSPVGLRALGYAPFRQMLRSAMAHAGMVRIDHVIGLARSFWVPANGAPGGYVRFPTETLLALIRIEAQRAGCVVIGEDLGTVPDGLREALAESGVYGCSILPFERNGADFLDPWHYRTRTLASFGTHDLPPMAGWWRAGDVETRLRLRHIDPATAEAQRAERAEERRRLCRMLLWTDLLPDGIDPDQPPEALSPALRDAIHLLVARSGLLSVSLDDMFGVALAQNVPGTVIEEPNWRRRAPLPVEEIEGAGEISRLAAALSQALHRPGDEGEGG